MIIINASASLLLLLYFLITKYIFKKRTNYPLLLLLISLLPLLSLLRKGAYESGDFNLHIYRAMAFFDSLKEGLFMPSWAADLNATYGYPLFVFVNPLPYYLISFFHLLGFSFIGSLKLYFAFSYIASGIFMYLFTKKIFKNDLAAFTSSIFYLFVPYHLVDLHFRTTIGEIFVFTLIPLILLNFFYLVSKKKLIFMFSSGLFLALLFMTHQGISVFVLVMILSFLIFSLKKNNELNLNSARLILPAFIIGAILSSYTWLPYLYLAQYTLTHKLSSQIVSFPDFAELIISPWRNGLLFQGPKGELSYIIGYTQLAVIIFSAIQLFTGKLTKKISTNLWFWLLFFLSVLFMITPLSAFIWNNVPLINALQFSTRLLLLLSFCSSIIAGYLVLSLIKRKKILFLILILTISYTILNWGHRKVIPEFSDQTLRGNLPKSTAEGEGLAYIGNSKWWKDKNLWINKIPKNRIEIIEGEGQIKEISRSSIKHGYIINSDKKLTIKDNTVFFPGWKVKINGKEVPIINDYQKSEALIVCNASKGLSYVEVSYNDLPLHKASKVISIIGFISVFFFLFYQLTTALLRKKRMKLF